MTRALASLLLATATLAAQPIAITHVTVIDATGQPALPDRTVILDGDRIQAIGESAKTPVPKSARIIDATGKFLIPGLWDMHIHFRGGADLIPDNEAWLSLFPTYGITGVREMGGDIADSVFKWRTEIANGTRFGPRILTSGPKLDGPKPAWPGSIALTDAASARAGVDKLKAMGSDFIKIYANAFPPDVFAALMDEAKKQGLTVGGHLPFGTITTRQSIDAGVHFIEHMSVYVMAGCSTKEQEIAQEWSTRRDTKNPLGSLELRARYVDTFNEQLARDLITRLLQHNVWITPTLAVEHQIASIGIVNYDENPLRKYVGAGIWKTWDPASGRRKAPSAEDQERWKHVLAANPLLLKMLQSSGVRLLAGSDSGASNNFTFPGWMLHRELALLVENGLTPMEALQSATRNPAKFINELDRNGTIERGKVANLVLLTANPLEDIHNTEKIDAVILKGKPLTRADLDSLRDKVAADSRNAAH